MKKRVLALLLILCYVLSAAPVYAGAATGQQVSAGDYTVTAGNSVSVTLKAENFENIAALDVDVYYDPEVLTVSSTSNGNMLSGAQTAINTGEAGKVTLSLLSLDGISGTGNLLTIRFYTQSTCTPGKYPITVAIGRAHDTTLAAVSVGSTNGSVTINERQTSEETFSLYSYVNMSTVDMGDILSYQVRNDGYRSFVSGDFTVTYDHELFAFDSIEMGSGLTGEGAIYSVNSAVLGQVRVTYASDTPKSDYSLFTVKLKVIADVDTNTTLKAVASNVYRQDLTAYAPGSTSRTVYLQRLPEVVDYPDAFLHTETLVVGQQSKSVFYLEAGAGIAAGDFTLTYDPMVLRCVSVDMAEGVEENGGMLVINDAFENGSIRFSYVNMDAYSAADLPLVQITWEPIQSPSLHYNIYTRGAGVVDPQQNLIPMDYITDSGCIFVRTVFPPLCLEDGRTNFTCACGESYDIDPVPQLGHDIQHMEAHPPTCTMSGCNAPYDRCTRCDYSTGEMIPALGHDEIPHAAKAPDCTELGWEAYVTCGRCEYTTYAELAPLGHRTKVGSEVWADPIEVDLGNSSVSFTEGNGTYYSNNHSHNSSSEFYITALYDCTLELTYGVSSEQNYDKLFVFYNSNQVAMISGNYSNIHRTLSLAAGDIVTIRYQKDVSVSNGEDRGWVRLEYEDVLVEDYVDVPSEELIIDCTSEVICSYCQLEVQKAGLHIPKAVFTWNEMHTACEVTIICENGCSLQEAQACVVTKDTSDPEKTVHTATITYEGADFTDTIICDNYTVTFLDWDGGVLAQQEYHCGDSVTEPAAPAVPDHLGDNYIFAGWDKEITACYGDKTYTAVYRLPYVPGDINCDNSVNTDDVLYLLLHVGMPDLFQISVPGDFTGDGYVTTDDVLRLLLHVGMPDLFPLII